MLKRQVAILFGGASSEHEVSRRSAFAIIKNISREKYDVLTLGISKNGSWYLYSGDINKIPSGDWEFDKSNLKKAFISPDPTDKGIIVFTDNNTFKKIELDVIIPVLHGKNGEDGTMQGLFELAKIPYVGCDVLSSSTCMDKIDTNIILSYCGIKKANFSFLTAFEFNKDSESCISKIENQIKTYPMFVKPSNAGSSVGISKAQNRDELYNAIETAMKEDSRILIEESIEGQEVECAVLGNNEPIASIVGEIAPSNEFYDYEAKYVSDSSLYIPAHISNETSEKIKSIAIKAYKSMGCKGLSRIDFFVPKNTNEVLLNEINTFPGFTTISMYPKLMDKIGIDFTSLIDKLIEFAIERATDR